MRPLTALKHFPAAFPRGTHIFLQCGHFARVLNLSSIHCEINKERDWKENSGKLSNLIRSFFWCKCYQGSRRRTPCRGHDPSPPTASGTPLWDSSHDFPEVLTQAGLLPGERGCPALTGVTSLRFTPQLAPRDKPSLPVPSEFCSRFKSPGRAF